METINYISNMKKTTAKYTNGWLKCPKCGQYHHNAEHRPYCSEDCERNKDD